MYFYIGDNFSSCKGVDISLGNLVVELNCDYKVTGALGSISSPAIYFLNFIVYFNLYAHSSFPFLVKAILEKLRSPGN